MAQLTEIKPYNESDQLPLLQSPHSEQILFMLILALGLALRLYRLNANELWLDETHSIFIAGSSFGDIIRNLKNDSHPPLYFILLLLWKSIFGDSEISVRMISVLFGTACLPAIYWLGKNIINKRVGLIGMFLAATNPLYIYYSQEAKMYIMLAFFSVLSSGYLWLAIRANRKLHWGMYVIASCLMVYTHIFGWFVLAAGNLFLLLEGRYRRFFVRLLLHQAVVVLAFLPFAPITLMQIGQTGQWVESWWVATPPALAIPKTLECMGAGGNYPAYLRFFHVSPFRHVSYFVFFFLAVVALLPYGDKAANDSSEVRSKKLFLVLSLLVPLMQPYVLSFIKPVYLVGRYEIMVFPFYALLIGFGIAKLRKYAPLALAVVTLLASYSLYKFYYIPTPAFEREAVRYLAQAAEEDDIIVAMGLRLCPFEYYARREGVNFRLIPYPLGMRQHPGWIDYRLSRAHLAEESKHILGTALSQSRPGRPVWLLTYPIGWMNEPLFDQFDLRMRPLGQKKELAIVSFTPKAGADLSPSE